MMTMKNVFQMKYLINSTRHSKKKVWAMIIFGRKKNGLKTVSYTHLDVYKRQISLATVLSCAIKGNNPIANNKIPAQP